MSVLLRWRAGGTVAAVAAIRRPCLFAPPVRLLSQENKALVDKPAANKSDAVADATPKTHDGLDVKVWGANLELPEVSKKQADASFLDATDVTRAITPPTGMALQARADMGKERFNYVSNNLNPASQYVVMGKHGAVAPAAVSQSAILIASLLVLMSAITAGIYIKKEWKVTSAKDLGDKLRERGAARKEAIEGSGATQLMRSFSQTADVTVKSNVDIIRRPTQQAGEHLHSTFKGGVVKRGGAESTTNDNAGGVSSGPKEDGRNLSLGTDARTVLASPNAAPPQSAEPRDGRGAVNNPQPSPAASEQATR